jgi:hypothetical protein
MRGLNSVTLKCFRVYGRYDEDELQSTMSIRRITRKATVTDRNLQHQDSAVESDMEMLVLISLPINFYCSITSYIYARTPTNPLSVCKIGLKTFPVIGSSPLNTALKLLSPRISPSGSTSPFAAFNSNAIAPSVANVVV